MCRRHEIRLFPQEYKHCKCRCSKTRKCDKQLINYNFASLMFLLLILDVGDGAEMLQTNEAETDNSPIRILLAKEYAIIAPKSHLCAWSCSYARKLRWSQALTSSLATYVSSQGGHNIAFRFSTSHSLWFLWFGVSVIVCESSMRFISLGVHFNKVHHGTFWL